MFSRHIWWHDASRDVRKCAYGLWFLRGSDFLDITSLVPKCDRCLIQLYCGSVELPKIYGIFYTNMSTKLLFFPQIIQLVAMIIAMNSTKTIPQNFLFRLFRVYFIVRTYSWFWILREPSNPLGERDAIHTYRITPHITLWGNFQMNLKSKMF